MKKAIIIATVAVAAMCVATAIVATKRAKANASILDGTEEA